MEQIGSWNLRNRHGRRSRSPRMLECLLGQAPRQTAPRYATATGQVGLLRRQYPLGNKRLHQRLGQVTTAVNRLRLVCVTTRDEAGVFCSGRPSKNAANPWLIIARPVLSLAQRVKRRPLFLV